MSGAATPAVGPGVAPRGLAGLLPRLRCPECGGEDGLRVGVESLTCGACATAYPIRNAVVDLRPLDVRDKPELEAWSRHWAPEAQSTVSQRFFSWYRKAVFARSVAYFVRKHFADSGLFVEAGSGTSESSIRIDKRGGSRVLAAVDIVPDVLGRCAPIMDLRLGGDIFRLPFRSGAIDGIWNVGVMEHFTHDLIDRILGEFHRVLAPGGVVILLWPANNSLPQKLLRAIEAVVNARRGSKPRFQFHPDEISKLRSNREGREVLTRNGFAPIEVEWGLRSLMAFKTVVGRKTAGNSV